MNSHHYIAKVVSLLLSVCLIAVIAGCGGPKKVTNQQMTLQLSYGDRTGSYTGEVNEQNEPNGKGKFVTKSSQGHEWIYEGEFKNGHFEGKGKTTWTNTKIYNEGTYKNDRLNGQGKATLLQHGNLKEYEGNFVAGIPMKADFIGLNEDANYADWTYRVTSVKTQNSAGNIQANGQFLIVTLDETNNGTEPRQPGAGEVQYFFKVIDISNGKEYRPNDQAMLGIRMANKSFNSPWYLSQVSPGTSVKGVIFAFDIAKDTDISNLVLLPIDSLGDVSPIKLQ